MMNGRLFGFYLTKRFKNGENYTQLLSCTRLSVITEMVSIEFTNSQLGVLIGLNTRG